MRIAITFAGRRDRMRLLVDQLVRALDRDIIDEWHVWNYARTAEDAAWIDTLPDRHSGVKVCAPFTTRDTYVDVYVNYAHADPQTVFVKLDDDIVFVDLDGLRAFIEFRRRCPAYYIVSANVINNVMCARVQRDMGFFKDLDLSDLHASAEQATALHRAFLAGESPAFQNVVEYNTQYPLNINCIAWLGADAESVAMCESTTIGRDEQNLSSNFPRIFGRPAAIFGPFVVSHLSFYTQEPGMDIPNLIDAYERIVGLKATFPNDDT